jgi:hypothetical protein
VLAAVNLADRRTLWTRAPIANAIGWSLPEAMLVEDQDAAILHAIDPTSGQDLATWGLGGGIVFTRDAAGGPNVVLCSEKGLLALDGAGRTLAEEDVVITGRVSCRDCPRPLPSVPGLTMQVGDVAVSLDRDGHYSAQLRGRGEISVSLDRDAVQDAFTSFWISNGCNLSVALTGRHAYRAPDCRITAHLIEE